MSGAIQFYPGAGLRLLLPGLVIAAAFWSRIYIDRLDGDWRVILENLPYLVCLLALVMAHQFNRCRLFLASIGVAVLYWLVQSHLQVSLAQAETARLFLIASLSLPAAGLYLLLLPERGIWTGYGLVSAVGFVLLLVATAQIASWLPQVSQVAAEYYAPRPIEGYVLSRGATLLVGLVVLVGLVLLGFRNEESEVALLGAFTALFLALGLLHLNYISITMGTAAGLCLVWGLLRSTHAMAYRDDLTGLLGRRALNERLKTLGRNYCIAMLDVDHFKRFNDRHGHDVGDEVLKLVASRVGRIGSGGTAYRYGGEEFCVVFPRKSLDDCEQAVERVRGQIADYTMSIRDRGRRPARAKEGAPRRGASRLKSGNVSVTISAGVASRDEKYPVPGAVIKAADQKLYRAKKAGRNRVLA